MASSATDSISPSVAPAKAAQYYPKLYGIAFILSVFTMLSLMFIFLFSYKELLQELRHWQERLDLVAEDRLTDISDWVQLHFHELDSLAENPALQLYLTEREMGNKAAKIAEDSEQAAYLRTLLNNKVQQLRINGGGIALLDASGRLVLASDTPPVLDNFKPTLVKVESDTLLDMRKEPDGTVRMGFAAPVSTLAGEVSHPLGTIVAIRPVDDGFYSLLKPRAMPASSLEIDLIRREGDNMIYLSPTQTAAALARKGSMDERHMAAAFAFRHPGEFNSRQDYMGHTVLVTGRQVPGTPWTLMVKIDRAEALAASNKARQDLLMISFLTLICVLATLIAVWRHATSKKSFELSMRANRLASRTATQAALLNLVTNNQLEPIYIIDSQGLIRFVNAQAADAAEMTTENIVGKRMGVVLGQDRAEEYGDANRQAQETGKSVALIRKTEEKKSPRTFLSEHIPLEHIPLETLAYPSPGTLIVEQDVTALLAERERRERTLNQLVETLILLIDRRDPYASEQSKRVADIARAIASEMKLDAMTVETTEIAAKLMNIGKIALPPEVLTKRESISDKERENLRESLREYLKISTEILEPIEFNGPVVETLRQAQENWDGTGPAKRKGEDILISARIVSVANAFVGMVSRRAFRAPMEIDQAIKTLFEGMDVQYDRKAVVALVNYLDNHGGRAQVKRWINAPVKAAS